LQAEGEIVEVKLVLSRLKKLYNPKNVAGMARFGSKPKNAYGIAIPVLRKMAKGAGKDHGLALGLWDSGIHEARILASMVDEPEKVTSSQMDEWASGFDSWDVCDQVCMNLFGETGLAWKKVYEWAGRDEEFVKRAAFALIAVLAWHDKEAPDSEFEKFLPLIRREAADERNFVKKAVNWALRHIGKRNVALNVKAIAAAKGIARIDSKAARWIAADALRELQGAAVQKRLKEKRRKG